MPRFNIPSPQSFISKVPSADSFKAKADAGINAVIGKVPAVDKFQKAAQSNDVTAMMESINQIESATNPGNLASAVGSKLGIKVDAEKVNSSLEQINEIKSNINSKAVEGLTSLAEKAGVHVNIPTEEEITNMIITQDVAENFDTKMATIQTYIESKLDSMG